MAEDLRCGAEVRARWNLLGSFESSMHRLICVNSLGFNNELPRAVLFEARGCLGYCRHCEEVSLQQILFTNSWWPMSHIEAFEIRNDMVTSQGFVTRPSSRRGPPVETIPQTSATAQWPGGDNDHWPVCHFAHRGCFHRHEAGSNNMSHFLVSGNARAISWILISAQCLS